MAYKRRYLSGQEAETVDIGGGAITPDKISPGAVGPEALAPDSVTGEKILDGAVDTPDLKDGAVTAPKIAVGAVTTEKIPDGAVTAAKIDPTSGIPTRPLTPGAATAEIADEAVTPAKLADDAVETGKIKDGAVSTGKIAAKAVTGAKIADDTIQSEQIQGGAIKTAELDNNSVSEGKIIDGAVAHDKLADDSVSGDKVADNGIGAGKIADDAVDTDELADDAVETEKLQAAAIARRHVNSLLVRESIFYDDFGGAGLHPRWAAGGAAGGGIIPDGVNGIKIQTGAGLHDTYYLHFGGNMIVVPNTHKPSVMFMLTGRTDPKGNLRAWMGLRKDNNDLICFAVTDVGPGADNWKAQTISGGVNTTEDTGVLTEDGPMLFEIDVSDPASVKFYIDVNLVATITTNIPAAQALEPWFYLDTGDALAKYWLLKYVNIMALKPEYV